MPQFQYQAVDGAGDPFDGLVEASGVGDALRQLEARGLTVQSIAVADVSRDEEANAAERSDEMARGAKSLAAAVERLMASADELVEPLRAYAKEAASGDRRRRLIGIADLLARGDRDRVLSAVESAPPEWSALLGAASSDAKTGSVFSRFVEREQLVVGTRRRLRIVWLYPLVIAGLCLGIAAPVACYLLPAFGEIYADFGLDLPVFTKALLGAGRFIENGGGWLLLGLLAVISLGCVLLPRLVPPGRWRWLDWFANRGGAANAARFAAHTADLIESGMPCNASVAVVKDHTVGRWRNGPPTRALAHATTADMPDTSRVRLLRALTQCYDERSTGLAEASAGAMGAANGYFGAAGIVAVGALVGGTVLALMLPLVKLIEGLT